MIASSEKGSAGRGALALGLLLAALVAVVLLAAKPAHAATFTVNSTGDAGDNNPGAGVCFTGVVLVIGNECTLRAAIQEANATTAADAINFAVPTTGVATISPGSSLPIITAPVVIDGYTQGDATENTLPVGDDANLRVRLDGANTGVIARGMTITASDSVVRGLSITNFPGDGLDIATADNTKIEGNFVGITPAGDDAGNGGGIKIRGGGSPSNGAVGNIVGGTTPAARNIISGNGPSSNLSGTGIAISDITTKDNKVMGNYIGTTKSGTGNMGNTGRGMFVGNGTSGNIIGDDNPADGKANAANVIAFNGLAGVDVSSNGTTGNRILSNSIFSNDRLGIDFGLDGPTPNDPGDADTGPNNLQNFPTLSSATVSGNRTTIKGTLDSTPNTTFTIQFFSSPAADPFGFGEGKRFLGQRSVATDGEGKASFTFKPARKVAPGQRITATATDQATGDTSEFSKAKRVVRRR